MQKKIKAQHFFGSMFKEFSLADCVRSIPQIGDGLKPSQRKAVYGMQLRGENAKEIKVATFAEFVSGNTDYHHGAGSLVGAIEGLARNYPGTNNMNLLMPNGQFGSRLTKEAAAERYIFTEFSQNFRKLFKKEDDILLENAISDGQKIEPLTYFPILPMSLINGAEGTGTGHACFILQYNPESIRDACLAVLTGKKLKMDTLIPWFKGFTGTVEKDEETAQIAITGRMKIVNTTTINIMELPVGWYVDDYKNVLFALQDAGYVKSFDDASTEDAFNFIVNVPRTTTELGEEALMKLFKLVKRETENFTLWNEKGVIEKFDTPEDIVERFIPWRTAQYENRRQRLIQTTSENIRWLSEKLRFILFYLANVDLFKNKKKDDLVSLLIENKFDDYDRLLGMSIWNLTFDKIEELKKEIGTAEIYLKGLEADTAKAMYTRELKAFSM